jgi:hypothetical protein
MILVCDGKTYSGMTVDRRDLQGQTPEFLDLIKQLDANVAANPKAYGFKAVGLWVGMVE